MQSRTCPAQHCLYGGVLLHFDECLRLCCFDMIIASIIRIFCIFVIAILTMGPTLFIYLPIFGIIIVLMHFFIVSQLLFQATTL